jgi:hypothetical protein
MERVYSWLDAVLLNGLLVNALLTLSQSIKQSVSSELSWTLSLMDTVKNTFVAEVDLQ